MPDGKEPRIVTIIPEGAEDFGESPTGSYKIYVLPSGEKVAVPYIKHRSMTDEDDEISVSETVPRQSTWDWVLGRDRSGLPPITYILGSVITIVVSGITALGIGHSEHSAMATERYVDDLSEECDERMGDLAKSIASLEAGVRVHKEVEAHTGALYRFASLESDVEVLNDSIKELHPRKR